MDRVDCRRYIVRHIDQAIEEGWVKAYFQPIVRSATGEVCEFETLARWIDPDYGFVSPAVFIDALEEARLIHKLDEHVVRLACEEWHSLDSSSEWRVPISVNLSRLDFELTDAFQMVDDLARTYEVPRQMLHVEVTESALTQSSVLLAREIERFRAAGYQVWLDDFGSGYSSLNALKDFHFDVVKIDMGFLRDFDLKPESRVIISSVVNMIKQLGMQSLIEGVETPEQFAFLRGIGCELLQGYLIGRPSPSEENQHRILAQELVMEHASLHGYYDRLGSVNSLSATPFDFAWAAPERTSSTDAVLPLALVEREVGELRLITANDGFERVFRELGAGTMAEVAHAVSTRRSTLGRRIWDVIEAAARSGVVESVDFVSGGRHFVFRVRFVASREGVDAFLISLIGLSQFSNLGEDDRMQIALQCLCAVYDDVNVIDLEEGVSSVLFRGSSSLPSWRDGQDAQRELERFAREYVHPESREQFVRFMTFSTVEERAEKSGRGYLVDVYRILAESGV